MRDFDTSKLRKRWDDYNRFYWRYKGESYQDKLSIIKFEEGCFILAKTGHDPEARMLYEELNIQIIATGDDGFPALAKRMRPVTAMRTVDGVNTPVIDRTYVPRASHFQKPAEETDRDNPGGMQYLLIDWDTHTVHQTDRDTSDHSQFVPPWAKRQRCHVFWQGAGYMPRTSGLVRLWVPGQYTEAEQQHLDEMRAACKAWCGMEEEEATKTLRRYGADLKKPIPGRKLLTVNSWLDCDTITKVRLANGGFSRKFDFKPQNYMAIVDPEGNPYPLPDTVKMYLGNNGD